MGQCKRLVFAFLVFTLFTSRVWAEHVIDSSNKIEYLYVVSSEAGEFKGDKLTLRGARSTLYFSDRPNRVAGHMSLAQFMRTWEQNAKDLQSDPPNAVISILDENGNKDVVIEISEPVLDNAVLTFSAKVLNGVLPETFGISSLFIDNWPTAVNGQVTDSVT